MTASLSSIGMELFHLFLMLLIVFLIVLAIVLGYKFGMKITSIKLPWSKSS